ncbi:MAG: CRISPR system precrRNA processing endoribonuclease RAMP protein Cas6 [Methylophilaceae bacterium]|nr:CRISPR system precrRNA processing endoribonuclease RAMP protein Cas6 [Methylophilaceae bacterium]
MDERLTRFPLVRYRFEFEVTAPLRLPDYAGSALRGAFGHALRQLACATRSPTCDGCALRPTCPYPAIFSPTPRKSSLGALATPPVPYVIEPPEWGARNYAPGEKLEFGFTLIGQGIEHLPLCIMAWRRAFARGVGAGHGCAELRRVNALDSSGTARTIHQPGEAIAPHPRHLQLDTVPAPQRITLRFDTPLRLQENGHALPPARLAPRPLLTALLRRVSLISEYHGEGPLWQPADFTRLGALAGNIQGRNEFAWRDWSRHSSRQQRSMTLGGCVGDWQLQGDLAPFWDVLRLGQFLHVGKEASFGLGRYRLFDTAASIVAR